MEPVLSGLASQTDNLILNLVPWIVLAVLLLFLVWLLFLYRKARRNEKEDFILESSPVFVPFLLLLCFFLQMVLPQGHRYEWSQSLLFGLLLLITAVWFMVCFSGDAEDARRKMKHGFIFAYAFTFGSFALLVMPFAGTDENKTARSPRPPEGVLQLVRGCMANDAQGAATAVSAITRCPPAFWAEGRPSAQQVQFTWLVSVGGVTMQKFHLGPQGGSFVEIHGGLAVPFFVVVLAFVGGAISLSRRIPEYQRRSDERYQCPAGADKEVPMHPLQARESVVFQIMQLVSAPFLAMATWYIVEPETVAAAATLAFGTGFASEPLLLMIRGMVEGLRPQSTVAAASARKAELRGVVLDKIKRTLVAKAKVTLETRDPKEMRTVTTDEQGRFFFGNIMADKVKLTATAPDLEGRATEKELILGDSPSSGIELLEL